MQTNLELFILAMVKQGIQTPYELKRGAGLSLGSTVPALARLEKEGMVKGSEKGARGSRRFSVTTKGAKALVEGWNEKLEKEHTDLDSILRVAYLAWLQGDARTCQEFLKRSAAGLRGWSSSLQAEADRVAAKVAANPNSEAFIWMRTLCEAARAEADGAVLDELAGKISGKGGRKRREAAKHKK